MFDFRLLFLLPKPKGSFFVCLLVLFCLAWFYWSFTATTADDLSGSLQEFLLREQGEEPKHPQILIAGSSLSGMGFHVEELEKRTGMPAAKISLDGSHAGHMLDILENYPNECQFAKIMFLEIALDRLATYKTDEEIKHDEKFRRQIDKTQGQFFGKNSGTNQRFDIFEFLRRSSMRHFMRECLVSLRVFLTPRVSTPKKYDTGIYEKIWDSFDKKMQDSPEYYANKPARILLQHAAEQVRKNRAMAIAQNLSQPEKKVLFHEKQKVETLYQLLDFCHERKIFVVVCTTPYWYGQLSVLQSDLEKPTKDRILSTLQEINNRSDCAVILCRDFEEITSEGTDEDYLLDYGHMTRKGAILYTNWLIDRLLENPKTAELFRPDTK